jgi:hypothetical protein
MATTTAKSSITGKQALQFIQSRMSINAPGKYSVQVINANAYKERFIIGLKAQSPTGLEQAKEALRAKDYAKAGNTNMSTSVFADASWIPAKGEFVNVIVDYVTARDGSSVLGVTNISEMVAKSAKKVDLGDEFANLLDEVTPTAKSKDDTVD